MIVGFTPTVPKAHAVAPTALSIEPSSQPLAAAGSTITYNVNVTNIPTMSGIDIYVRTNNVILNPTASIVGTFIPSPFEISHCINGLGIGCDTNDGPGVVHEAFASISGGSSFGNGTLFTITYTAVSGPGTSVAFPESMTTNTGLNSLFDPSGFNITGVPEASGLYGVLPPPDLSISAGPVSPASILATNSGSSTITLTSLNGFAGTVVLTPNPSTGLTCSPLASVILTTGGTATSTLTCQAAIGADYAATVTGVSGPPAQTITSNSVTFHVVDLTLSCSPITTLATVAGSSTCIIIPINGFTGVVSFSVASAVPSGCTASISASIVISVTCVNGIPPFDITVCATIDGLTRCTTLHVTIQDFSLSAPPINLTTPGVAGTSQITLTSVNGFSGAVNYALTSTQPAGCSASVFSTGLISASCSPLPTAPFIVTVRGTSVVAASLFRDVNGGSGVAIFLGEPPTVSLGAVTPASIVATQSGSSTITVTSKGTFAGIIAFTANPSPGLTCDPVASVNLVVGGTATSTLTCHAAIGGDYSATVRATGGTPTQIVPSNSVTFRVVDFAPSCPPITTLATVAGSSTCIIIPINGFTGPVTFSVAGVLPSGCSAFVSAGIVISVTCVNVVPPFDITVCAISDGLTRCTSLHVTTQDFSLSAPGITLTTSGAPGASQITVTPINGFSGTLNYVVTSNQPSGCTATVTPAAAPVGALVTLSVTCSPLPSSSFVVTVSGTVATALTVFRDVNGAAGVTISLSPGHVVVPATLSIEPSSQPLATAGSTVTYKVNVTNTPATFGANIYVITNPAVLKPTAVTLGTFIPSPFETSHCINGLGVGCDTNDGPGVVHEAFVSIAYLSNFGDGTLFTITYLAVSGPGTRVAFPEMITTNNGLDSLFDTNGFNITGIFEDSGTYGSVPAPDFSVSTSPVSPASILATNSGSSTITVTSLNGFAGNVTLTANPSTGLTCGAVASVTLAAGGTATSTLTCSALTGADYTVTLTGVGPPIQGVTTNSITFHVVDFSLSAIPPSLTVVAGDTSSTRISVTPINGFSGAVTFAVTGATASCTATIGSSGVLTVSCPSAQTPTTFRVTVTGTSLTSAILPLSRTLSVSVTVPQNLSPISATPSLVYLETDNSGFSTITVVGLGSFTGTVCLTASGAPLLSPSINPACVTIFVPQTSASTTLTFAAIEGQTPTGTYRITVIGSSGTSTATTAVTVIVLSNAVKFKIGSSGSVSIGSGGVETWTATLRNRSPTTQYALVTIVAISSTAIHTFTLQTLPVIAIPPGNTIVITATHNFTSGDIGLTFHWNALVQFGTSASNLDQVGVPFRSGSFTVTA